MLLVKKNFDKEHFYRFGISKTKYYIVRRNAEATGLFSLINTHLGHIVYAKNKGYIPVVDMMNYPSCYLEPDKVGVENAWDYFFEQPCGVDLETAYAGRCVRLGSVCPINVRPDDDFDFFDDKGSRQSFWREAAHRYLRIRKDIIEEVEKEYNSFILPTDRVLGTLVRGTDYIDKKPKDHPVQPRVDDVITKCKMVMKERGYNKIFVATEDYAIALRFQREFGDKYCSNKRSFISYEKGRSVPDHRINRDNDFYWQGREYLSTIAMLSKSKGFVGGRTSGSVGATLLSSGFEYMYVYKIGRYQNTKDW